MNDGADGRTAAARRAQRLIGASFFPIAACVGVGAVPSLIGGDAPEASCVGIGCC